MATNQEGKQESFRNIAGTTLDYNGDALSVFQAEGATSTNYNGAFIQWLQIRTSSSQTNVNDLQALFASQQGFDSWGSVNVIPLLSPTTLSGLILWLDGDDETTMTFNYQTITETATGTISTNTITASADVSSKIVIGNEIRIDGVDLYTVTNVVTDTITTSTPLVASYATKIIQIAHISQHDDKSTVGNDVTEGTANKQPILLRNKLNGRSVVDFDGVDDRFSTPVDFDIGSNMTIFVVGAFATTDLNAMFIEQSTDIVATDGFHFNGNGNRPFTVKNGGIFNFLDNDLDWMGTDPAIVGARFDGFLQEYFKEGVQVDSMTGVITNTTISDTLFIGGRATADATVNSNGYFAEIIIYNRALTDMEQSQVNSFLSMKWGITV